MEPNLSILERRRIEAEIVKPIYEALKAEFGVETAQRIIADAVKAKAIEFGKSLAESGTPSVRHFAELLPLWKQDDALETETLTQNDTQFDFNVTRCRYAEMYREMGLQEIGHLLSCNRDASFCDGYDPRLKLTRTQTIMQGAPHCDFRYRWEE
ncbi:MAG: 2-amino-thiazoline-4-carboxylic acid hydrolase [Armatimonadetes bacterium]|nr:2-amino-thiazoline-4-carboxylic acid hydrolase [Armatimonadota bacterium]